MSRAPLLLAALLALAACARGPASNPGPDPRAGLTPERLAASPLPILFAEVPERGARATLAPIGENGGVVTWATGDDVSLSFRGGLVTASRGLGFDLMSADLAGPLAALAGGPPQGYARHMSYLDGENRTVFRSFLCDMGPGVPETIAILGEPRATVRRDETCRSSDGAVGNSFWIGADGTVWRSRQWLGPDLGSLGTELLRR